ncbi:hypothetical protein [Clostridium guangxiense]|uniref:hypothetical protein n=1 Tax=Clostridium guangxiense TaxID=1662055 RepID=UPI001E4DF7EC|nr:hypothetical protein [Clostridium guangxiense]MCD2348129.1 hypothetical protein [Clostridium guangxiense]
MNIINPQNYFTNKQIQKIIKLLGNNYRPNCIVIYETRTDVLKSMFRYSEVFTSFIFILLGKIEGLFYQPKNRVSVFIFSENDDGDDKESKQLYSLHALLEDCDRFATSFLDIHSKEISKIMKWKEEWTVEEES